MNWKTRLGKKITRLAQSRMLPVFEDSKGKKIIASRIASSTFIDHPKSLNIGDNVYIGHYNYLEASFGITIEEGCQITNFVNITSHSSHLAIRLYGKQYTNFQDHIGYNKGSIIIGRYTFIGPYSVVMPNTKIGKGCIVSAYSYVKGDYPDFSIIKGNPAKVVGDTRDLDKEYLEQNPELNEMYKQWVNER